MTTQYAILTIYTKIAMNGDMIAIHKVPLHPDHEPQRMAQYWPAQYMYVQETTIEAVDLDTFNEMFGEIDTIDWQTPGTWRDRHFKTEIIREPIE